MGVRRPASGAVYAAGKSQLMIKLLTGRSLIGYTGMFLNYISIPKK